MRNLPQRLAYAVVETRAALNEKPDDAELIRKQMAKDEQEARHQGAVEAAAERIIREIRRRTRVVGAFPDGKSALMLCAARLRHIASTKWGTRRYMNMDLLLNQSLENASA